MNDILFEVLKSVIIVSIMIGMKYILPWIKENTSMAKYKMLIEIVRAAVQYAEQTISEKKEGAEKKALVMDFLKKQLKAKNISISDEQLNALVESAVYTLNANKEV